MPNSAFPVLIAFAFISRSVLGSESSSGSHASFCYDNPICNEYDSTLWPELCRTGLKQSPINLPLPLPETILPERSLQFNQGYAANSFYIIDNGHTVQIQLEPTTTSSGEMTGYELNGPYVFAQAHLHWGTYGASEHTLDNFYKSGEIHLVHYAKKYGSLSAAVASNDPKGLAVLGVLLEKTRTGSGKGQLAMGPIVRNLPRNYSTTLTHVNESIDIGNFLPLRGSAVYRYEGSLTTPGCSETVLWTVVKDPLHVPKRDLDLFETLGDAEGKAVLRNNRYPQPLNDRTIQMFTVQ